MLVKALLFSDVFVPDVSMFLNVRFQQGYALRRIKVEDFYSQRAQPLDATLKCAALADDYRAESKLADQATAIPARRQRRHHDEIAIAALASSIAKGVGFAMCGGIAVLDAPIVARADEFALGIKDRRANRNAALSRAFAGFGYRDRQHCSRIDVRHGLIILLRLSKTSDTTFGRTRPQRRIRHQGRLHTPSPTVIASKSCIP